MNVDQIDRFIGERLLKIPVSAKHIEIAFFGGNFTGQKDEVQRAMLKVASKYIDGGRVASIRISTRPDEIDHDRLSLLKEFGVRHIELGAQSMSDDVLRQAGRGHTSEDTIRASSLITDHGFVLGLQMMVGLPGDTLPTTLETARRIVQLGASETRIYPLLVFKETPLHGLYLKGLYKPLTIEEVIEITAPIVQCFEESHVKILRVGLHPSEDLLKGEMVAGPWHPALRQMIYSRVWEDIFRQIMTNSGKQQLNIKVASRQYPAAVGYQRQNKLKFPDIHIQVSPHLKQMQYEIDHC